MFLTILLFFLFLVPDSPNIVHTPLACMHFPSPPHPISDFYSCLPAAVSLLPPPFQLLSHSLPPSSCCLTPPSPLAGDLFGMWEDVLYCRLHFELVAATFGPHGDPLDLPPSLQSPTGTLLLWSYNINNIHFITLFLKEHFQHTFQSTKENRKRITFPILNID